MEHITLFYGYFAPKNRKGCVSASKSGRKFFQNGETINGIFQLHEKDRSDPGGKSSSPTAVTRMEMSMSSMN